MPIFKKISNPRNQPFTEYLLWILKLSLPDYTSCQIYEFTGV